MNLYVADHPFGNSKILCIFIINLLKIKDVNLELISGNIDMVMMRNIKNSGNEYKMLLFFLNKNHVLVLSYAFTFHSRPRLLNFFSNPGCDHVALDLDGKI